MADNIDQIPSKEQPASTPAPAAKPDQTVTDPFSTVKPAAKAPPTTPAKPAEQLPAKAPADDKPFQDTPPKGVPAKAVKKDPIAEQRARIEEQNKVIASTTRERDELKQRMAALESRGGGETQAMTKLVEELRKKNEQLAAEISSRDYSKSDEYKTKYEKPFNDAAEYGRKIIESLQVLDSEGNAVREAKWETDFAAIFNMPAGAARQRAKELFGDEANTVMQQYYDLHRLQDVKTRALDDWQKGATEREQKEQAEGLIRAQNVQKAFSAVTDKFLTEDELFQIKPDDAETKALWDKSQAIVDKAYFDRENLAPHEVITLDAAIRLRAINEPVLRAKLGVANERIAELEARIAEYEGSTNGKTRKTAPPSTTPSANENWEADLKASLNAA